MVFKIVERFKLNEEILKLAIPILCKTAREPLNECLGELLTFYSSAENNENLRFIALEGLKTIQPELLQNMPQCVYSLLLDDDEEVRNEVCTILNPTSPLNLAQTLREFVDDSSKFIQFLNTYEALHAPQKALKIALFEKEPLNLFIDIQFLRMKFTPK